MDGIQDMGLRIVQAARLAVAVHLYESVARHTEAFESGSASRDAMSILRQRKVATGGAGPTEPRAANNASRLGDLVTDDEWDGLMGRDDRDGDEPSDDRR